MLVSDFTAKVKHQAGEAAAPAGGDEAPQREGRELARTWRCGPAPAPAVASGRRGVTGRPAQLSPARPDVGSCAPLRSPAARRVPCWVPRVLAQRPPQPLAPPSPGSAAPHAATPQSAARLTYAVAARGLPAPRSAPSLGSRHPPGAGVGRDRAGRGAAPPNPEPPGATGRGGQTGESLPRGAGGRSRVLAWGRRLDPAPGGTKPSERASRSLNAPEEKSCSHLAWPVGKNA